MEGAGGGAITDVRLRHGRRLSVFRSYVYPYTDRPNLTVLTGALFTRLTFEGRRASGVEVLIDGSRGRLRLTGPNPSDPIEIEANILAHPADLEAAKHCVELSREIGNSAALRPFAKREVMPAALRGPELEHFVRDGTVSYWHQSCTAKMGRDPLSVVDGQLRVYGVDGLRIADASILPRITTGNTMAPCVIVGERAADLLKATHGLTVAALAA